MEQLFLSFILERKNHIYSQLKYKNNLNILVYSVSSLIKSPSSINPMHLSVWFCIYNHGEWLLNCELFRKHSLICTLRRVSHRQSLLKGLVVHIHGKLTQRKKYGRKKTINKRDELLSKANSKWMDWSWSWRIKSYHIWKWTTSVNSLLNHRQH